MKYLLLFFFTSSFLSSQQNDSLLLERYVTLSPYHDHLKKPVITETHEKGKRNLDFKLEDDLEKFEQLLEDTREEQDITSPAFLSSPLGKAYRSLENFLDVHQNLNQCRQSNPRPSTSERLDQLLNRFSLNASSSEAEGPCEYNKRQDILSNAELGFMNGVIEAQLEQELFLDALTRSLQSRVHYEKQWGKDDITSASFQNKLLYNLCYAYPCSSEDRALLETTLEEVVAQVSSLESLTPMNEVEVNEDINERIDRLNHILESYTQEKEKLEREWEETDAPHQSWQQANFGNVISRRRRIRKEKLLELKKEVWERYQSEYQFLYGDGAGDLLQTHVVREGSGITQLEELRARFFGIRGFEEKVLKKTDDFPSLRYIKIDTSRKALEESFSRTEEQVRELLEMKRQSHSENRLDNITHMLTVSPGSAGHVLLNNPQYADIYCSLSQDIARKERRKAILETGTYLVIGGGIAVAGILTAGTALPLAATIGALAVAGTFTAGDIIYRRNEARRNRELQEDLLNAFLAGTGDDMSLEDIRRTWRDFVENDYNKKAAFWFGAFDVLGIPHAARAGTLLRLSKTLTTVDTAAKGGRALLFNISGKNRYVKWLKNLMENHPKEEVSALLNSLAALPSRKQRSFLDVISQPPDKMRTLMKTKPDEFAFLASIAQDTETGKKILLQLFDDNRSASVLKVLEDTTLPSGAKERALSYLHSLDPAQVPSSYDVDPLIAFVRRGDPSLRANHPFRPDIIEVQK